MSKIIIRESLNELDRKTDNAYDLRSLYESVRHIDGLPQKVAELISGGKDAKSLYEAMISYGNDGSKVKDYKDGFTVIPKFDWTDKGVEAPVGKIVTSIGEAERIKVRTEDDNGFQHIIIDLRNQDVALSKENEKLIQSASDKAFRKNVATEIKAGKPQKQALAIAYSIKDKNESVDDESDDVYIDNDDPYEDNWDFHKETWIDWKDRQLRKKGRANWDQDDYEAWAYIENTRAESQYYDESLTEDVECKYWQVLAYTGSDWAGVGKQKIGAVYLVKAKEQQVAIDAVKEKEPNAEVIAKEIATPNDTNISVMVKRGRYIDTCDKGLGEKPLPTHWHNHLGTDGGLVRKLYGGRNESIKGVIRQSMDEGLFIETVAEPGYEPKKKGIAYKVFKVKNGKLYPPMVANPGGADTPVGVWLKADEGEFAGLSKTGRPQVKSTQTGTLSYRPGWHLGDVPRASQFDRTNKETGEKEFPKDFVWAECEYTMDVDYQKDSDEQGYMRTKPDGTTYRSDKYQHSLAGLPRLPKDGYYKYRTNPRPDTVPWVITGAIKVKKLLDDAEVNEILKSKGIEPIHRQGGDKTLAELGLAQVKESQENIKESKYAPAEERAKVKAFVPGDHVKMVSNTSWTDSANDNIGRTGVVVSDTWQGGLHVFQIKADDHRVSKHGYDDTTFLASADELEMVTDECLTEKYDLEPRQRTAVDGKTWWVAFDKSTKKYATITTIGKYKTKGECQQAIDKFNADMKTLGESKEDSKWTLVKADTTGEKFYNAETGKFDIPFDDRDRASYIWDTKEDARKAKEEMFPWDTYVDADFLVAPYTNANVKIDGVEVTPVEHHLEERKDDDFSKPLVYDEKAKETWAGLFDVADPQEVADEFGRDVVSGDKTYYPKKYSNKVPVEVRHIEESNGGNFIGKTVKEYKDNHDGGFFTVWADEPGGGFGHKGSSVYGNNDDLVIKDITKSDNGYDILHIFWNRDIKEANNETKFDELVQMLKKSNDFGREGYRKGLRAGGAFNPEFIEWVTETVPSKYHVRMYTEYNKGWVAENVANWDQETGKELYSVDSGRKIAVEPIDK